MSTPDFRVLLLHLSTSDFGVMTLDLHRRNHHSLAYPATISVPLSLSSPHPAVASPPPLSPWHRSFRTVLRTPCWVWDKVTSSSFTTLTADLILLHRRELVPLSINLHFWCGGSGGVAEHHGAEDHVSILILFFPISFFIYLFNRFIWNMFGYWVDLVRIVP